MGQIRKKEQYLNLNMNKITLNINSVYTAIKEEGMYLR